MKTSISNPIHVTIQGNGPKTALLIHGLAGSSETWQEMSVELIAKGYTVITPDLRGHGKSPRAEKYSVDTWADDIIALDIKPDLIVGHSMGGLIASKLQAYYKPEQTILLDPVFRLPAFALTLKFVHHYFRKSMLDRLKEVKQECLNFKNESLRAELRMLEAWDKSTVMALQRHPAIVSALLSGKHQTMLVRAKKSYIVPKKLGRKISSSIKLFQFPSSHDIHVDSFDMLWRTMSDFMSLNVSANKQIVT